jgi:hypothetical protein
MRNERKPLAGCAIALLAAAVFTVPRSAHADPVNPPPVPANLQAPAGTKAFLVGHARGYQAYVCIASSTGFTWTFFGPQATLFAGNDRQLTTHFLSPNPNEAGTLRATWQHSQDTSSVWARAIATSSDPAFVEPGAIPWLLLEVVGAQGGPRGGADRLTDAVFIHRVNTTGGITPSTGCSEAADVGARVFVPYTADYFFYRFTRRAGS